MSKTLKIYIAILVFILALVLIADHDQPKPIDWRPTYSVNDKIPYGLYVFDKEIKGIFKSKVERISTMTPYEYLDSKYDEDTLVENYKIKGTFINISETNAIDEQSIKEIFYFVSHGNNAFLSMKNFPRYLLDTLKIDVNSNFQGASDTQVWLANKKMKAQKYTFPETIEDYFLTSSVYAST